MNNLGQALYVEWLKARRSRMPLLTMLGFLLIPVIGGFFMVVLKDPVFARRVGLISAKAQLLAAQADWPTYLGLLAQTVAIGGVILCAFIGTWVFGREYADRTLKDLLALPTSRSVVVSAKFALVLGWAATQTAGTLVLAIALGAVIGLSGHSTAVFKQGILTLAISAGLTILLATPIAFVASAGRGYLSPLAAAVLAVLLAQLLAIAGYGEYFPWSIPALYAQGGPISALSVLIVLFTSIAGMAGTLLWWEHADHTY